MKNLSLGIFLLAISLFVGNVSGQISYLDKPTVPAAPGKTVKMRSVTSEEANKAFTLSRQSSGKVSRDTTVTESSGQNPPMFVVYVSGDSWDNGITVNAMSVADIPTDSILFGTIVYPDGSERNLYAWYTEEGIPAGNIWYNFENQRKPGYNEPHGNVRYKMTVITGSSVRTFWANANFGYAGSAGDQIITDGVGIHNGWSPKFYLFGNFGTGAGVVMKIANSYTFTVPAEAISFHRRVIEIDTSKITGPYFPYGDYTFSVASSSGVTDNGFQVRVLSDPQSLALTEQKLRLLTRLYSR